MSHNQTPGMTGMACGSLFPGAQFSVQRPSTRGACAATGGLARCFGVRLVGGPQGSQLGCARARSLASLGRGCMRGEERQVGESQCVGSSAAPRCPQNPNPAACQQGRMLSAAAPSV